ncbi:MAG: hypothetical protein ACOC1P_03850 [Minisyncoccales bacterium]
MTIKIEKENIKKNLVTIMRRAGYKFQRKSDQNQLSFVKPIRGGKYPRFHIYIEKGEMYIKLNLHLDQRKTHYKGSHAHGAEYSGEKIKKEGERIKNLLLINKNKKGRVF